MAVFSAFKSSRQARPSSPWWLWLALLSAVSPAWAAPGRLEVETAFLSRGVYIPATVVVPMAAAGQPAPLVLMAHGHGGDRDEAGAFSRMATLLADAGIASVRMDFSGCGENPDPFTENNLGNMLEDLIAARGFATIELPVDPDRIGLLGYSMGARVAVLATQRGTFRALALWSPVALDGAAAIQPFVGGIGAWNHLRQDAERDGRVLFISPWGQEQQLGLKWFEDIERSQPQAVIADYPGALLVVHGEADEAVPPDNGRALVAAAGKARATETHFITGADHGLGFYTGQPELFEDALAVTTAFLARHLNAAPAGPGESP